MKIMPDKIASAVSYCVSGTLVCGGSVSQWIHDLDWNKIAVISGIIIGIATYFTNLYYQRRRDQREERLSQMSQMRYGDASEPNHPDT